MNSLSFFLAGLPLVLFGLAVVLGSIYPLWAGLGAVVSGAALVYDGAVMVAYEGFVPSIIKLVGLLLLVVLMWRNSSRGRIARSESAPPAPAQHPVGPRWQNLYLGSGSFLTLPVGTLALLSSVHRNLWKVETLEVR